MVLAKFAGDIFPQNATGTSLGAKGVTGMDTGNITLHRRNGVLVVACLGGRAGPAVGRHAHSGVMSGAANQVPVLSN